MICIFLFYKKGDFYYYCNRNHLNSYNAVVPRERRFTTLEYKQKKKEYHDSTAHGFEMLFDKLQIALEDFEAEM